MLGGGLGGGGGTSVAFCTDGGGGTAVAFCADVGGGGTSVAFDVDGEVTFVVFDADGGGSISTNELGKALRSVGQDPTNEEVENMIKNADADASGEIDFKEFLEIMVTNYLATDEEEKLRDAFEVCDPHERGIINPLHLR